MKWDACTHINQARTFSVLIRISDEKNMSRGQINSLTCLKHTNALRVLGLLML